MQFGGHRIVQAKGGSVDAIPKPSGHAEQPKPSVHAPSAQLRSLQRRHVSCSTARSEGVNSSTGLFSYMSV